MKSAAVDIGSMGCRLLIVDGDSGVRIRRSVDTTMGGAGPLSNGHRKAEAISDDALGRVADVLAGFCAIINEYGVESVCAVATESARRATNFGDLNALVMKTLGVPLRLLDGDEEAHLSFLGVCTDPSIVADADKVVVLDIGGGSIEVVIGVRGDDGQLAPTQLCSLALSSMMLSRQYLHSDPPKPEELSAALSVVELYVDDLRRHLPQLGEVLAHPNTVVVGTGAIGTIAAVEVGVDESPLDGIGDGPLHAMVMKRNAVEEVFRTLATESRADRAHNPGLPPSRVDFIVGGCVVLVEIMRQLGLESITVAKRGLADGVVHSQL